LLHYFPNLCIIGEEDVSVEGKDAINLDANSIDPFASYNRELEIQKLTVWVDPLDGTSSFVIGALEGVTTLIGIAYEETPIFGIIHQVFGDGAPSYFGGIEFGTFYKDQEGIRPFHPVQCEDFTITGTRLHKTPLNEEMNSILRPDRIIEADGCGNKSLQVVRGIASSYFTCTTKTYKWDMCPSAAFMRAFNGFVVDYNGRDLPFNKEADKKNQFGAIVTLKEDYKYRIIEAWRSLGRDTLA